MKNEFKCYFLDKPDSSDMGNLTRSLFVTKGGKGELLVKFVITTGELILFQYKGETVHQIGDTE